MAEQLEADLQLSTTDALRTVDELRDAIESALVGAAGAFEEEFARITGGLPPLEVETDASSIEPAIDEAVTGADTTVGIEGDGFEQLTLGIDEAVTAGDSVVSVEGDTSALSAEIDQAVEGAEATITVDADTSAADAAVDDLGSSAEAAGGQLQGLSGGAEQLSGVAGLATGSVSGLGSAVGNLGGHSAATFGLIGAVGGALGVFFSEAVDAKGATQRFNSVLGDMAGQVENLRGIDGLNTNLGDLALKLGSDDDKVRTVAARLFELASASGIAKGDASQFTQEMVALGARAVALNPELGDMGDVTDALSTALVRGGRFASKFGLDLNQNDINARALNDTHKVSVDQLSFVEKAMAGAALASEKYGGNLDQVVARGADNAITKQRRLKQTVVENFEALGAPLVAPIFELMEAAIPTVQNIGRSLSTLGQAALPVVIAALDAVNPILTIVADVLEAIPGPVLAAATAFLAFRGPTSEAGGLLASFGGQAQSVGDRIGRVTAGLGLAVTGFQQAGKGGEEGAIGVASLAASGALLGSQFGPQGAIIGGVAGAVVGLGAAMFGGGESVDEYRAKFAKLGSELDNLNGKQALQKFFGQLGDSDLLHAATGDAKALTNEIEALASKSPAAAQKVIEQLQNMKTESGKPLFTGAEFDLLESAVDKGTTAYGKHTEEAKKAAAVNQAVADAADTTATAYDRAKAAADEYRTSLEQLDAGHTSAFQAETQFAQAQQAVTAALAASQGSIDLNTEAGLKSRDALSSAADQARNYSAAILESGGTSEAARAPLQGLTDQISTLSATSGQSPGQIAGLLNSLGLISFASPEVQAAAAAMGISITGIGDSAAPVPGKVDAAMQGAKGAIATSGIPGQADSTGKGAAAAFNQGVGGVKAGTDAALQSVQGLFIGAASLAPAAAAAGSGIGAAFSAGIEVGIARGSSGVQQAARDVVADAEAAARARAQSHSPSRLFAALGEDLSAGVAVGMGDKLPDVVIAAEDIVRQSAAALAARAPDAPTPPTDAPGRVEHSVTVPGIDRLADEVAALASREQGTTAYVGLDVGPMLAAAERDRQFRELTARKART